VGDDFKDLFGDDWLEGADSRGGHGASKDDKEIPPQRDARSESVSGDGFTSETENFQPRIVDEKEVKVSDVFRQQQPGASAQYYVLLYDNKGRQAPIWVGQYESWAIKFALDGQSADRPLTHDLFKTALDKLGARVVKVVIDDLWREIFYAKVTIVNGENETMEIDARPSDAIAIALRVHAPIYMSEYVLEQSVFTGRKE